MGQGSGFQCGELQLMVSLSEEMRKYSHCEPEPAGSFSAEITGKFWSLLLPKKPWGALGPVSFPSLAVGDPREGLGEIQPSWSPIQWILYSCSCLCCCSCPGNQLEIVPSHFAFLRLGTCHVSPPFPQFLFCQPEVAVTGLHSKFR